MGYSWNNKILKGNYVNPDLFAEIFSVCDYVLKSHCASDFASNCSSNYGYCGSNDSSVNGSYAGGCSSHNSSVESTKYSSKCVNSFNRSVDQNYIKYL